MSLKLHKFLFIFSIIFCLSLTFYSQIIFAQNWISSRLKRPFGINRIRQELITKGVDKQIIQEEIEKLFIDYGEEEIVCALAKRQSSKYKNIEPNKVKNRVYGYLMRRGFNTDSIIKAVQKL